MSLTTWILVAAGALAVVGLAQVAYLAAVLGWEDRRTVGLGYFGLTPDARRRFKDRLRLHARLLRPILWLSAKISTFSFQQVSFEVRGLSGPKGTCSAATFAAAEAYRPGSEDVFVAAPMKCGTTWMLHLVYQLLHRGQGDLVGSGTALHAVVPWLESRKSVPVDEAPRVGRERPSRLIKTHLPASRCPFAPGSRYVYVTRHPVSCFASVVDFLRANAGAMAPEPDRVEAWFCSEEMWWGPWPDHLAGWWRRARSVENVLFVPFEEMKRDLRGVLRRLTRFLDVSPLSDGEAAAVLEKCTFEHMSRHGETFEMHPPHILAVDADLFVKGTARRHEDVPAEVRRRIYRWCASRLEEDIPLRDLYPEPAPTSTPPAAVAPNGCGGPSR